MRLLAIPSILFLVSAVWATPISRHAGEKLPGHYIVKLKQGASTASLLRTTANVSIKYQWDTDTGFNGFAGQLDDATLQALQESPDVELIAEDGYVSLEDSIASTGSDLSARSPVVQTNAPWNLARISSIPPPLISNFYYDSSAGQGSDIYLLDTGVYVEHPEFSPGRAKHGPAFSYPSPNDGNGHGTHAASIAIGTRFGVAKLACLFSIKVLSDAGSGSISDIVSGINWAVTNALSTGRPSTISMSIGGSVNTALDSAVTGAVNRGIPVVVFAGSSNADAANFSPARVPGAITVAASTQTDSKASFSNFGSVVDIFAPGQNIIGAWPSGIDGTNTLSGSPAVPHVAGAIAYYQALYPGTPILQLLLKHCSPGVIIGVPTGTTKCLVYNGNTP